MIMTGYDDYTPIKWAEEYSVGSTELDSRHKTLLDFYNRVLVHCSGSTAKEREYFNNNIEPFINLLVKHFDTEEQSFSGTDYQQTGLHILDHLKLLEKINNPAASSGVCCFLKGIVFGVQYLLIAPRLPRASEFLGIKPLNTNKRIRRKLCYL